MSSLKIKKFPQLLFSINFAFFAQQLLDIELTVNINLKLAIVKNRIKRGADNV
jgi:hypothetical protein